VERTWVGLVLLGRVRMQPRRAHSIFLRVVHVHPERGLQPVDRVAEGGDHLRRVRAGAWAGAVAGARARARAQAQAQARAWARAWAKLGARVRAEATLARPWP